MCGVRDGLPVVLGMLRSGYILIVAMSCVHARWGKRPGNSCFTNHTLGVCISVRWKLVDFSSVSMCMCVGEQLEMGRWGGVILVTCTGF